TEKSGSRSASAATPRRHRRSQPCKHRAASVWSETLSCAGGRANNTAVPEIKIAPALGQQLLVRADLNNAAMVKDKDRVGSCDGGQSVRDDQGSAAGRELPKRFHNAAFDKGIQTAGGFVKNDDGRVAQHCSRDGNALALPAG